MYEKSRNLATRLDDKGEEDQPGTLQSGCRVAFVEATGNGLKLTIINS